MRRTTVRAYAGVCACLCAVMMSMTGFAHPQTAVASENAQANLALCDNARRANTDSATSAQESAQIPASVKCRVGAVHADAFAAYVDASGKMVLASRADEIDSRAENGVRYDPSRLIFVVDDTAKTTVAATLDSQYDFLRKATVNNEFWQIPFSRQPGMLWAGFSSEALTGQAQGSLLLNMESMSGPQDGAVYMWTWDGRNVVHPKMASPNVAVAGAPADQGQWSTQHQLEIGQHEHVQWAFTRPGTYVLTMKATAQINGQVQTAVQAYTFQVGSASSAGQGEHGGQGEQPSTPSTPSTPEQPSTPSAPTNPAPAQNSSAQQNSPTQQNACLTLADLRNRGRQAMVIEHGHVDIAAYTPVGGGLAMAVQEDSTGSHVLRDTSGVVFWVHGSQARNGSGYSIPQSAVAGVPWLGWNNQSMKPHLPVSMTLLRVQGPGSVHVWLQGNLGQANTTVVSTSGPYSYTMMRNTHTHANWDFSAPGYYTVTLAYAALSGTVTRNIHFAVGDVDPWKMPIACTAQAQSSAGRGVAQAAATSSAHGSRGGLPALNSNLDGDAIANNSAKLDEEKKDAENADGKNASDENSASAQAIRAVKGKQKMPLLAGVSESSLPLLEWMIITCAGVILSVLCTCAVLLVKRNAHA